MRYLPHTKEDIEIMLSRIGISSLDELFPTISENCHSKKLPDLPEALTEWELCDLMNIYSRNTASGTKYKNFIGAGNYEHYIPSTIYYLLERSEFLTAYTPYQPEISQGTLQAVYEYQSLVSRLLGMEVANASLYDGASALAEALLMAIRIKKKKKVLISSLIHPHYRQVVNTYFKFTDFQVDEIPYLENGLTDISILNDTDDVAAVAVQSPNFFGCIESLKSFSEAALKKDMLFIVCFSEPFAYGLLKNPGSQGADIACGEGQSFGVSQLFGGPGLGMFASKMKFVRNMPGRLVGKTNDLDKKRGFVLTLATREQHIRREKATSNICTNNSLCAIAAAIYISSLGGTGLQKLAKLNYDKSEYLKKKFINAGLPATFKSPTFNEFVVKFPKGFKSLRNSILKNKIIPGLCLEKYYPELSDHYLICATETKSKEDLDLFVKEVLS